MPTGRDLATKVLLKAGVVSRNETPSAEEINDTLDAINDMLESWSNDSLVLYTRSWETFPLLSGVSQYTIGPGKDFDTSRPMNILAANLRFSGQTFGYDMAILNDIRFNNYVTDVVTQGVPEYLNYDGNNPVGVIRLWPIPSIPYDLFMLSEKVLTKITLDDEVNLPPGWNRAIIHNGAVEIAADYGQEAAPSVQRIALQSLGQIKSNMAKRQNMDAYPMSSGTFDVYRGW